MQKKHWRHFEAFHPTSFWDLKAQSFNPSHNNLNFFNLTSSQIQRFFVLDCISFIKHFSKISPHDLSVCLHLGLHCTFNIKLRNQQTLFFFTAKPFFLWIAFKAANTRNLNSRFYCILNDALMLFLVLFHPHLKQEKTRAKSTRMSARELT